MRAHSTVEQRRLRCGCAGLSLSFKPLIWGLSFVAACRRDMTRPPLDHLRVRSIDLEDTRRWPWASVCSHQTVGPSRHVDGT
jgi:hypothetical protein